MASSRKLPSASAQAFLQALQGKRVAVGLSGGVDSVVLLHLVKHHPGVRAIHVHHGLSPNADKWAAFCRRLCKQWNVPITVARVRVKRAGKGLEAAAREARHAAFAKLDADVIALAHQLDDQAETVLMNLLRGTGVRGAAGMQPLARLQGKLIARPLLDISRKTLEDYARLHRLEWIEDESNADEALTRNFVRRRLGPLIETRFPQWKTALARAARLFAAKDERAQQLLRNYLESQGLKAPSEAKLAEMLKQLTSKGARTKLDHDGRTLRVYRGQVLSDSPPTGGFAPLQWKGERRLKIPALGRRARFCRRRGHRGAAREGGRLRDPPALGRRTPAGPSAAAAPNAQESLPGGGRAAVGAQPHAAHLPGPRPRMGARPRGRRALPRPRARAAMASALIFWPHSARRRIEMKRLIAGVAAAALLASGAALAQPKPNPSWPKTLTLGTASVGGTFFVYGQVWASLVNDKLGTQISTQQTQGPNQNIILTDAKQIDLGMTTMGVALQAWEGKGDWTKGKQYRNIRAMFPMYDTPFHFVALKKSGIKAVKDIDGKRAGVGPRAGTCGTYFPMMFKTLGINATIRNGQASDMAANLQDGLIDAFPFCAGIPIAAYSELETTNDVQFFTYTADEIKKLKAAMPELSDSTIPKGTYKQLSEDHKTVGVFNFAIAHKDLPEDLVYGIVKSVLENNEQMVKGHAAAKETVLKNWERNTFLPFHPGAVRYFKEKGINVPDKLVAK